MKIVCFGSDYKPTGGGIATYSQQWLQAFESDNRVTRVQAIFFANSNPRTERLSDKSIIRTFKTRNFFLMGMIMGLYTVRFFSYNVFHSFNLFPVGFWNIFWTRLFFRKGIVTFHGSDACDTRASIKTKKLKALTVRYSYRAIAVSEFTKDAAIKHFGIKDTAHISVIYAPFPALNQQKESNYKKDAEKIALDLSIKKEDRIILTVCRLVERKGVGDIVTALSQIGDPHTKLLVVGDGPERKRLFEQIKKSGLQDRVAFTGFVKNVEPYYYLADVFVLASFYRKEEGDFEGLGLVLLEAQARGVPVIGTRSGGIPEAIDDGESGYVVDERDISTLEKRIAQVLSKNNTKEMMVDAWQFLFERFGVERNIDMYIHNLQN